MQSNLIDQVNSLYAYFHQNQIEEILARANDDVRVELVAFGQVLTGKEGFRQFLSGFKQAFPDLRIEPAVQFASGEYVCCEFKAKGTHLGPLMTPAGPIQATGKSIVTSVCEVW
ncbi:MAG TPA: ester cyclase, partial [Polyangiaceae bacterium]|nr:ester cyclase [Polyangiaceae bacterium]